MFFRRAREYLLCLFRSGPTCSVLGASVSISGLRRFKFLDGVNLVTSLGSFPSVSFEKGVFDGGS